MEYAITTIVADSPGYVDISEDDYKRIKVAIANLFELLFFEENLDLVTENFQEYEAELLLIASRDTIFNDDNYFSTSHDRVIVSRRIVNLLSACRMYLDQCVHHITNIYGENSDNVKMLKDEIASQYDKNFGFRVMEALRNYTQHRGFPIQSVRFSGEWIDIDNTELSRLVHTVVPLINPSILADDNNFKRAVLDEMLAIKSNGGIDIRPLIRTYIECIGKVHEMMRNAMRQDVKKWEGIMNDAIKLHQDKFGTQASITGLAIVAKKDDNHWVEKRTIFKEFIERRQALERKNSIFANLHKRYASNEVRKKDA
jgi:hypothetical protein